ncbi:MAG: hypothetical protein K8S94_06685 [Planctomycetia bacterium]|nr:hypothetical protein [Planctomycetia bacterium]
MRAIHRRAVEWNRRARRAVALALITAGTAAAPSLAQAQMGQMGMAPATGVVNRAVSGFQQLNESGPGWLYYGINAADRGLGYQGSYMTLGGFIPYAEDDLGGFWAADLRGHLSEYGGFFSNVGLVRKQFLGGSLLGVGVYWDYDGDANQYPTGGALGTATFGQFGHVYNQVGVSGEWLTDFGNLRSNGYIPVGSTAYTVGSPNFPFYQNLVMCQNGLDAALGGADLEVGAYIPGLSDWAGMISVGGYALGNSRYDWNAGALAGQDVVPWFGGVYTRLDMTFIENWDFSLQYNNDSYFDSTGFARLTYRMGGSRRRNVPDQMEQPMMRNEHIVRAHQTPIVSTNPNNGSSAWRVIHVNNAAGTGGDGTSERPFQTVAEGNAAATQAWDIVFVDPGNGLAYDAAVGLNTTFTPLAANQYFVGNGAPFYIPTDACGLKNIATLSGVRPLLTNPTGPSIEVTNGLVVNNFNIVGSQVGILGTGNLSSGIDRPGLPPYGSAVGASVVNNVAINGTQVAGQTGVLLDNTTGDIVFQNTTITDMTKAGFAVDGGDPNVDFSGQISNNVATNGGFTSPVVDIKNTTGGTINLAVGAAPSGSTVPNKITDTGGGGIKIADNSGGTINIGNATLTNTVPTAIDVTNSDAVINVTDSAIIKNTAGTAVNIDGGSPVFAYDGKITNDQGHILHVNGTKGGSVSLVAPAGSPFLENGDGILVENSDGDVTVVNAKINSQMEGILVQNSSGVNTFNDIAITGAVNAGVSLQGNTGTENFNNLSVTTNNATGFLATNNSQVNVTGNSQVTSTGAPALKVQNTDAVPVDLNMNFKSLTSGSSTTNGIYVDNATGNLNATTVKVTDSQATGIVITNSDNLDVNFTTTTVTAANKAGANGVEVTNTNQSGGTVNLGTVNITTQQGTGLQVTKSGTTGSPVTVAAGTIAATGGPAVSANGSTVDITLTSAQSTNSTANGFNVVQSDGKITIDQTTINSPTGVGINLENNVPGFKADFGVTTVSAPGAEGVRIVNATDPTPDTYASFDSLAITSTSGAAGILARNGGTVNFNSPATVATSGGPAVDLENTTGTLNDVVGSGWTFNSLTSTNSTSNGIRLVNLNSDFQVLNGTTVDGAAGISVLIADTEASPQEYTINFNTLDITNRQSTALSVNGIAGQVIVQNLDIDNAAGVAGDAVRVFNTSSRGTTGGRTYIESGNIAGTIGNSIVAQDSILRVAATTIEGSTANAIFAQALAGQTTTIEVLDSAILTATIDGVRLEASGSALGTGTINGTVNLNRIDVVGPSIDALNLNSFGVINLAANSNFGQGGTVPAPGAGPITLDNTFGGFLGISQASIPELTTSNNGAATAVIGVINFNTAVPQPPPPAP